MIALLATAVELEFESGGESPLLQPEDDAPEGVPASLPRSLLAAFFLIRDRGGVGVLAINFGDGVIALEVLGVLRRFESRAAAAGLPF